MYRKSTKKYPKVIQKGGLGAANEPPVSGLDTLWAALVTHMVPRPPQRASKTPPDVDLLTFLTEI